jgi:hypothetical protein
MGIQSLDIAPAQIISGAGKMAKSNYTRVMIAKKLQKELQVLTCTPSFTWRRVNQSASELIAKHLVENTVTIDVFFVLVRSGLVHIVNVSVRCVCFPWFWLGARQLESMHSRTGICLAELVSISCVCRMLSVVLLMINRACVKGLL